MPRFYLPLLVWICAMCVGGYVMLEYDLTPSDVGSPPRCWPQDARLAANSLKPTIVMFIHPRCPCTRASLAELSRVMDRCPDSANVFVVLLKPTGAAEDWLQSDLHEQAQQISGVQVIVDQDGRLVDRFHAQTSGETVFYSDEGELCFHGGITSSRGHQGDNAGRNAIMALLTQKPLEISRTPVFGCSLREQSGNSKRNE